jgi:hypothetical protein
MMNKLAIIRSFLAILCMGTLAGCVNDPSSSPVAQQSFTPASISSRVQNSFPSACLYRADFGQHIVTTSQIDFPNGTTYQAVSTPHQNQAFNTTCSCRADRDLTSQEIQLAAEQLRSRRSMILSIGTINFHHAERKTDQFGNQRVDFKGSITLINYPGVPAVTEGFYVYTGRCAQLFMASEANGNLSEGRAFLSRVAPR